MIAHPCGPGRYVNLPGEGQRCDLDRFQGCSVECYSGHTYAQEPRRLVTAEGARLAVAEVEQRWRTPEGLTFRVRMEAGDRLDLCYAESDDRWSVAPLPARELLPLLADSEPPALSHEA